MRKSDGFTLVELLVVVLIIGILASVALPLFVRQMHEAAIRSCYSNQRALEGAVMTWLTQSPGNRVEDLAGTVNAENPLMVADMFKMPPRCPAGTQPTDPTHPTADDGAYTFNNAGTLLGCPLGERGAHGHY